MGNRAIIKFDDGDEDCPDDAYVYEHWFSRKEFLRKLRKAIRRGYRRDCLASAYVAVSAEEHLAELKGYERRKAKESGKKVEKPDFVTTVRILSNPEPWYDGLDVESPIVVRSPTFLTTTVTFPNEAKVLKI